MVHNVKNKNGSSSSSGALRDRTNGCDFVNGYHNEGNYNNHRNYYNHRHAGGRRGRNYSSHGGGSSHHNCHSRHYQNNFPQLQTVKGFNGAKAEKIFDGAQVQPEVKSDEEVCSEPSLDNFGLTPTVGASPMPPANIVPQLNLIWQGLPPNYEMDPEQLFILSGPYPCDDVASCGLYEAHQVPKGVTVLATPSMVAPLWPSGMEMTIRLQKSSPFATSNGKFNPDAAPFYPSHEPEPLNDDKSSDGSGGEPEGQVDDVDNETMKPHSPTGDLGKINEAAKKKYPRPPSMMVFNTFFPNGKEFPLRQPQPPVYFHVPENPNHRCTCQEDRSSPREENVTSPSDASTAKA